MYFYSLSEMDIIRVECDSCHSHTRTIYGFNKDKTAKYLKEKGWVTRERFGVTYHFCPFCSK